MSFPSPSNNLSLTRNRYLYVLCADVNASRREISLIFRIMSRMFHLESGHMIHLSALKKDWKISKKSQAQGIVHFDICFNAFMFKACAWYLFLFFASNYILVFHFTGIAPSAPWLNRNHPISLATQIEIKYHATPHHTIAWISKLFMFMKMRTYSLPSARVASINNFKLTM